MKIDANDPSLTAFALGELDADEAALLAARLEAPENDVARRAVEEIRRTADSLAVELQAEPIPGLTDQQRARITSPPPAPLNSPAVFTRRIGWAAGLAAAACLALAVALPMIGRSDPATVAFDDGEPAPGTSKDLALADIEKEALGATRKNDASTESTNEPDVSADLTAGVDPPRPSLADGLSSTARTEVRQSMLGERSDAGEGSDPTFASKAVERRAPAIGGGADADARFGQERSEEESGQVRDGASSAPASAPAAGGPAGAVPEDSNVDGDVADRFVGGYRAAAEDDERLLREELDDRRREQAGVELKEEDRNVENAFVLPAERPASTFSIDVDTASYADTRRLLNDGRLPDPDAIRIEEFLNAFSYDYAGPPPGDGDPFAVHVEVNQAPWNAAHRLVRIALKGREITPDQRPASNLVFLVDVSESMDDRNKLPLVKESLGLLVDRLAADDRIAIVTCGGDTNVELPSSFVGDRDAIESAIERLSAGESTNGAAGIDLAYEQAADHFIEGGVNRVVLCTDGDFDLGATGDDLVRRIESKRGDDVSLSVFGFGAENRQHGLMTRLSEHGNGNHGFIDTLDEARRRFVDELSGMPVTIARDFRIQVEFDPRVVDSYRLIGYENRVTAAADVADDARDAGEIGAGHAVTVLYEIAPTPARAMGRRGGIGGGEVASQETVEPPLMQLRLRFKQPDGVASVERLIDVTDRDAEFESASADFRFAAAVASFGMVLRDSPHKGDATLESVLALARSAVDQSISAGSLAHVDKTDGASDRGRAAGRAAPGDDVARLIDESVGGKGEADAAARRAEEREEFLELVDRARSVREQP